MKTVGIPIYGEKSAFINMAYINYVAEAGFVPILINKYCKNYDPIIKMCDALLLPGGIDVDPLYYFEDNNASLNVNPEKDAFERYLLCAFSEDNKKIFGICRGLQLIAREIMFHDRILGESLRFFQHLNGHSQENNKVARHNPSHTVTIARGELYGGPNEIEVNTVNSMHHQALLLAQTKNTKDITVGSSITGSVKTEDGNEYNMVITAASYKDIPNKTKFVIEGIKLKELGISAVQWHPEELMDVDLLVHALGD